MFYLHSRLLERAAKLTTEYGGGSLTALPIIETQANDVSAYIPTNVISITDGQIFLEPDLFYAGIRPALNVGISVSRVGVVGADPGDEAGRRQDEARAGAFRELAAFAQFALGPGPRHARAARARPALQEVLKQPQFQPFSLAKEVTIIYALTNGFLDDVPVDKVRPVGDRVPPLHGTAHPEISETIQQATKALSDDTIASRCSAGASRVQEARS